MAQKKRKKRSWLRTLLFYLLFPLIVWFIAFIIWFYWHDLTRLFSRAEEKSKPATKIETKHEKRDKPEAPAANRSQEKILDEDRRKLEDILKQRQ